MYTFHANAARIAPVSRRTSGRDAFRYFADIEGSKRAVDLPAPSTVAAALTVDADLRRKGRAVFDGSTPVVLAELFSAIGAELVALPDRDDAEEPYRDLIIAATAGGPVFREKYVPAVARAWRDELRPVDTDAVERGPSKTRTELQAERRARRTADEVASARFWFAAAKAKGVFVPGDHIPASKLYLAIARAIDAKVDEAAYGEIRPEVDAEGHEWRTPTRRVVAQVAAEFGLAKRRSRRGIEWGASAPALAAA